MSKWNVVLNDRLLDTFWIQEGQTLTIGRGETADVGLDNVAVSRQHATLELRDGIHLLTDLGSANGTLVNGTRVKGTLPVTETDHIQIGKFRFVLLPTPEKVPSDTPFADFEATFVVGSKDKRGPRLRVAHGKALPSQFYLGKHEKITLGKDATCDVRVRGWLVANVQCAIRAKGNGHYLEHMAGWRRTTVNGEKIHGERKLDRGDLIGIGGTKFKYE